MPRLICVCRDLDDDSDNDEEGGGEAVPVPGVLIFAINAPMYFANVQVCLRPVLSSQGC